MLLSGLWHGANITFVIWGAMHALFLTLERFYAKVRILQQDTQRSLDFNNFRSSCCCLGVFSSRIYGAKSYGVEINVYVYRAPTFNF